MTRRRVEIGRIEDNAKRHTTFTKRRQGLVKKSRDFAAKFDAEVAVISFSKAGNVFAFGHPSVDSLVGRYLALTPSELAEGRGVGSVEEEQRPPAALAEGETETMIREALEGGNWDSAVEGLGLREIEELSSEIVKIKRVVAARSKEIEARGDSRSTREGGVPCLGSSVESVISGNDGTGLIFSAENS